MSTQEMWRGPFHFQRPHRLPGYSGEAKEPSTRTSKRPKYYIIDFGMSRRYPPDDPHPTEDAPDGGDRTVPEFGDGRKYVVHDPFAVDIYCVGNVIQKRILDVRLHYHCSTHKLILNVEILWLRFPQTVG